MHEEIVRGAIAVALVSAACSSSPAAPDGVGGGTGSTAGATGSGGSLETGGDAGQPPEVGSGAMGGSVGANGTTLTGSADGTPFTSVGSVLWAGMPDVAASTVIYVFSNPIQCSDITQAGWDTTITNKTQILEVKAMGTTPGVYQPIIRTPRLPAAGEAQVNYTLSLTSGTPMESFSTSGSVTLNKVRATTSATGSFDLMFGVNALKGTFQATFCAAGREP